MVFSCAGVGRHAQTMSAGAFEKVVVLFGLMFFYNDFGIWICGHNEYVFGDVVKKKQKLIFHSRTSIHL